MIELVEELSLNQTVYLFVETTKDFIFGEYVVMKKEYKGIKNERAELRLKSALKKERYFRDVLVVEGFRIAFNHTQTKFLIYDDLNDGIKEFCKKLKKNPELNVKLEKKYRQKYPNYFY